MKRFLPVACVLVAAGSPLAGCAQVKMPGMSYEPQNGWIREDPTSEHRMIQYRLRGETREAGDARLVVYYFGPKGIGSVEANLHAWAGQFQQPDGGPSLETAEIHEKQVNGLTVHTMEVDGTYVAKTPDGEQLNQPDRSLHAAVVLSDAGPYYFKVVGPTATVLRWDSSIDAMLASLEPLPVPAKSEEGVPEGSVEEVTP